MARAATAKLAKASRQVCVLVVAGQIKSIESLPGFGIRASTGFQQTFDHPGIAEVDRGGLQQRRNAEFVHMIQVRAAHNQ